MARRRIELPDLGLFAWVLRHCRAYLDTDFSREADRRKVRLQRRNLSRSIGRLDFFSSRFFYRRREHALRTFRPTSSVAARPTAPWIFRSRPSVPRSVSGRATCLWDDPLSLSAKYSRAVRSIPPADFLRYAWSLRCLSQVLARVVRSVGISDLCCHMVHA